ncbi:MAG: prepilin-type N-terminal cleavage/methylation domain-containing protein [Syntrophorhabdus sp.]
MKLLNEKKGFTIIEFLIGVVVLGFIVMIAFPLHGIRARKSEQAVMKCQLQHIWKSEADYRSQHGTYTADITKLANWKPKTKKYFYSIRDAGPETFVAEAQADLNNDKICDDLWIIDENGTLINIR